MKKTMLALAAVGIAFGLTSCTKEQVGTSFEEMLLAQAPHVTVAESDFETNIVTPLTKPENEESYTEGAIEYVKGGEILARVDFEKGENGGFARITKEDGDVKEFDCDGRKGRKGPRGPKGRRGKGDFEKVIVTPLVKSQNCEYIVSGVIKFYKDEKWLATIDFGDGTCDDLATKDNWKGDHIEFHLSELHK